MKMMSLMMLAGIAGGFCYVMPSRAEAPTENRAPENLYTGELVSYPGPWSFMLGKNSLILVSDAELETLATDPDKVLNLSLTFDKVEKSFRQLCEESQRSGARTLIVAFDQFFAQYRPGQDKPRQLMPDMDAYVEKIGAVSKFAAQYGLGLELSFLSPLELGPGYRAKTGESGFWMHYRRGLRDPKTGAYSVELWRQAKWVNNKGPILLEDAGVRVFAFNETPVPGTPYSVVDPASIIEISDGVKVETWPDLKTQNGYRIRVYGEGHPELADKNRVLVVQQYRTPEMDYFSPNALPFMKQLVDKYADAGVKLNGLYSDEMHIQQDWNYFGHHDNGEFAVRFVSDGLRARFAEKYGESFRDFAKYMVYFTYGQNDTASDVNAKQGRSYVFGNTPEAIQETALFRARYYRMLQDGVVDLFTQAKRHAETRMGHRLEARAHATWAQSPTIDKYETGEDHPFGHYYEYTSNFVWSNTVHQASAACYDYFKWGDFLTGNGNDHAEGGWLDRNYYGLTLACSTGILNEVPYSYAAHWGMPDELNRRRFALVNVYGASAMPGFGIVEDMQHRDVEVLMLYPMDLVAVEERFGSWMTQYGYANYISQDKLLERGTVVTDGARPAIEIAGRRFTTLVALFEPFPKPELLELMHNFADKGGRLIWSGPPPLLNRDGANALGPWQDLFGVAYTPTLNLGRLAPGQQIAFEGPLARVPSQTILTDFQVDHIFPVTPKEGTDVTARSKQYILGTHRKTPGGGTATFLGFRPRDDQSKSLGYETRTWFELLNTLGAYPGTGHFENVNDNNEFLSRTTPILTCRFPNGALAFAPHFRETEEAWGGGFARKQDEDKRYLEKNPPPSALLKLEDYKAWGHTVTYEGQQDMAFRADKEGNLIAFAGGFATRIVVDGKETVFADTPINLVAWAPVPKTRQTPGGALIQFIALSPGIVHVPDAGLPPSVEIIAEGTTPGSRGTVVPCKRENGKLTFEVVPGIAGRWLYVAPTKPGP